MLSILPSIVSSENSSLAAEHSYCQHHRAHDEYGFSRWMLNNTMARYVCPTAVRAVRQEHPQWENVCTYLASVLTEFGSLLEPPLN